MHRNRVSVQVSGSVQSLVDTIVGVSTPNLKMPCPVAYPARSNSCAHSQRSHMHRLKVGRRVEQQDIDTTLTQQVLSAKRQNSYQPGVLRQNPR